MHVEPGKFSSMALIRNYYNFLQKKLIILCCIEIIIFVISNKMFLDNSALDTTHLFGCTSRPGNDERDKMVLDSMTQNIFFTKAPPKCYN